MPGARCAQPPEAVARSASLEPSRSQVYVKNTVAPRRPGLFATVIGRLLRQLDTSVGVSGPHDFAVRIGIARLARRYVHRIPPRRP
jgi:hypothetical protein